MKTNILTFVFLILSTALYCQSRNNSYFDFFGHKYFLSDTIYSEPGVSYHLESQSKTFKYTLCGKHLLNEKKEKYMYGDNKNFFILKTFNYITDCLDFQNVVDSLQINKITKENDFKIVDDKNDYKIMGFKIVADSIDYVISYTNTEDNFSNKDYMKSNSNDAKQQLIKIVEEHKNCTNLILTDLYYYKKNENRKFYLKIDILIKN